jgi:hypothetical protein
MLKLSNSIRYTLPALVFTIDCSLPSASAFVQYSQGFASISGTLPYTYTHSDGTLLPDLTLSTDGVINSTGTVSNFAN